MDLNTRPTYFLATNVGATTEAGLSAHSFFLGYFILGIIGEKFHNNVHEYLIWSCLWKDDIEARWLSDKGRCGCVSPEMVKGWYNNKHPSRKSCSSDIINNHIHSKEPKTQRPSMVLQLLKGRSYEAESGWRWGAELLLLVLLRDSQKIQTPAFNAT